MDHDLVLTMLTGPDGPGMLSFLTEQMSAKHGLWEFGSVGTEAIKKELEQLVYRNVMEGQCVNELTFVQEKAALQYLMFLKQKRCGKI